MTPAAGSPPTAGTGSAFRPQVDAHVHLWDPAVRTQAWMTADRFTPIRRRFGLEDLEAAAAGTGVSRAVLIQNLASTAESLEFLATAAASEHRYPRLVGVVGWVDLRAPDVADQIAAQREAPGGHLLVGIRHPVQDETDPGWLTRPDVVAGLVSVGDAGLSFDILANDVQLPAALRTARAVPACRFILDHLGQPPIAAGLSSPAGQRWYRAITALAAEPNVAMKISGLFSEGGHRRPEAALRPWVRAAIDAFGPDRSMFASDWPVCLLGTTYPEAVEASGELLEVIDAAGLDAIAGGTADRWYRLSDSNLRHRNS